jgi:hypothetical protein
LIDDGQDDLSTDMPLCRTLMRLASILQGKRTVDGDADYPAVEQAGKLLKLRAA